MSAFCRIGMLVCSVLLMAAAVSAGDIVVSIPPQKEIVQALCDADVEVLIAPGVSPETWSASPGTMTRIVSADLYVPIGLPFEEHLRSRLRNIAPELSICTGAVAGKDDSLDPHIWLDPEGAAAHARAVAACLKSLPGMKAENIDMRLEAYLSRLQEAEKQAKDLLAPCRHREFLVYHPAFGHFARRFGLVQLAIEKDGKAPSARWMTGIITRARSAGIGTIFVQPSFASDAVRAIAGELHAGLVELDPLAGDLVENIVRIAGKIAAACPEGGRGTADD